MTIEFDYNLPFEVFASLNRYSANAEITSIFLEHKYTPDQYIIEKMALMEKSLSKFALNEIKQLFECFASMPIAYSISKNNFKDFNQAIEFISSLSRQSFIDIMLEIYDIQNDNPKEHLNSIIAQVYDYEKDKDNILQAIEIMDNFDETIERILYIVKRYYKDVFASFEKELELKLQNKIEDIKKLYASSPEIFANKIFCLDKESIKKYKKAKLYVSCFYEYSVMLEPSSEDELMIIFGYQRPDHILNETLEGERQKGFFKILFDSKRLELLKLLSKKEMYGAELAKALDISTATLSHHVSRLLDIRVITFEEGPNKRIYYKVDRERIKTLFDIALKSILGDE